MTRATNEIQVQFQKDGWEITLDMDDCIEIINALARRRQLECWVENVAALRDYSDCVISFGYAFSAGESRSDEVICVQCDGQDFLQGSAGGE